MAELIQNTVFGHLLRLLSRQRVLPYVEEQDPSLWKQYIHHDMTQQMAFHGRIGEETLEEKDEHSKNQKASRETSSTRNEGGMKTNALGHGIDQEKGKDVNVIHWYGENDPEVGFSTSKLLSKAS